MLRLPLVRVGLVLWLFSPRILAEPGPAPSAVVPPSETAPAASSETAPAPAAPVASGAPAPAAVPSQVPYYYVPPVQGMAGVAAQPPPPPPPPPEDLTVYRHDGFFARVSLGVGYQNAHVEPSLTPEGSVLQQFGSGSANGAAVHSELLLGGTPTPGFVVGSGLMNWNLRKNGRVVDFLVLPLFVNYYLDAEGPWFLQGFVGIGTGTLGRRSAARNSKAAGLALGAGGGWETWVGEQGSLGLALRLVYANTSKDEDKERYSLRFILPTLSGNFTFH